MAVLNETWERLSGAEGLMAKQWRTRLAAIDSFAALFSSDDNPTQEFPHVTCSELLNRLIFNLALADPHVSVRIGAIQCARMVFDDIYKRLPVSELDRYTWGFLAASVDEQMEVENVAAELFLSDTIIVKHCSKDMMIRLVYKFVTSSMSIVESRGKTVELSTFEGFQSVPNIRILFLALEGAIKTGFFTSALTMEDLQLLIPLLVSTSATLFDEYDKSGETPAAKEISKFLGSLGTSDCRCHAISMISSGLYEGSKIAAHMKTVYPINEEISNVFEKLEMTAILRGLSMTLDVQNDGHETQVEILEGPTKVNFGTQALKHIVQALQIPHHLVNLSHGNQDGYQADLFIQSRYHFLKIANAILKESLTSMDVGDLVQELILSCAALASAEYSAGTPLSWITKDIQELASGTVKYLGSWFSNSVFLGSQTKKGANKVVDIHTGSERLITEMIPDLILKVKSQLRDHLSEDKETDKVSSSRVNLESSIIAAYQLYWCVKQVQHPHLSPHSSVLIPCALMALDHYSPHVKREAMKLFLHLKDNLNPTELRWYKDAILDCFVRSIIGSAELWPLIVQTAVQLVKCLEGVNPRSKWYRNVLDEMLGELERHQRETVYVKAWLQYAGELFEALGLLLVAHFKRLLPLLFFWLHMQDELVTLQVLESLSTVIKHTWPRIPFHIERFWKELIEVYRESSLKKSSSAIRESVFRVCKLLKLCGSAFEKIWERPDTDPTVIMFKSDFTLFLEEQAVKGDNN